MKAGWRDACIKIFLSLAAATLQAQVVPAERLFLDAWRSAGHSGVIPSPEKIVSVRTFGATGNGTSNDHPAVTAAIASLGGFPGVVYFPPGAYLFNASLLLPDGVVLRGEGSDHTILRFNVVRHCISITRNQNAAFQPILSGYHLHSRQITVANGSAFLPGDYAETRQNNDPEWNVSDWARYAVGQIVRISEVSGNVLTLEQPLRLEYGAALVPEVRKINPIHNVGIENLKIDRLMAGSAVQRNNMLTIHFRYAANGWVRGCEVVNAFGGHVGIEYSTRIEVTGCHIHHAYEYDGGGSGYGVRLEMKTGECKIENNIFHMLRHAMLVQAGANGNVFGYNYAFDAFSDSHGRDAGDLCLHGNYPYANLFEGNIVQHIWLDSSHGVNGPYNLFFRNRAERNGFNMTQSASHRQSIVGNELFQGGFKATLMAGNGYRLQGSSHYTYGNNHSARGVQPAATGELVDFSYYLGPDPRQPPPKPAWWTISETIPTIGPPHPLQAEKRIPAYARYHAAGSKTVTTPIPAWQPTGD